MPLTPDDKQFLKGIYQNLQDKPLEPGDPRYQALYDHPGSEDPVEQLQRHIDYADSQSLCLFSGFRGSGKTTELLRLKKLMSDAGATVLYADALDYVNPGLPIEISDLLIILAGAFSDALEEEKIDLRAEGYWTRLWNYLTKTEAVAKEVGLKMEAGSDPVKGGAELKLELRTTPSFRQKVSGYLKDRLGELRGEVAAFFEDGIKAIRKARGNGVKVVFLFDSLEQIRGSLSNEQEVTHSIEVLFSNYLKLLEIPYLHVVYTVPPWLKFVLPGTNVKLLPCLRLWNNDVARTGSGFGIKALRALVTKRFSKPGLERFFGHEPFTRADRLLWLCGGHLRDLLLLLRETVLQANELPVSEDAIGRAIVSVRSNFLPIARDDARWLARIERERTTLHESSAADINRLMRFLDTHVVLYLKNGAEWYDVHPLVREEVLAIAAKAEAANAAP